MNHQEIQAQLDSHWAWARGSTDYTRANLSRTDLRDANLEFVDLRWGQIQSAMLNGTSAVASDLTGADLSGANLEGANLGYAKLQGADLSGANLRRANLAFANLQGANLEGAILDEACLNSCIGNGTHIGGFPTKEFRVVYTGTWLWIDRFVAQIGYFHNWRGGCEEFYNYSKRAREWAEAHMDDALEFIDRFPMAGSISEKIKEVA